jgi:hypothetical protein
MEPDRPALANWRDGCGPRATRAIPTRHVLPLTPWVIAALLTDALSAGLRAAGAVVGGAIAFELARFAPDWVVVGFALGLMVALVLFVRSLYSAGIHTAALLCRRYVRVTGQIGAQAEEHVSEVTSDRFYSYHLWVDRKWFTLSSDDYERVGNISWGTLEYAPLSRTIFTLRDATGRLMLAHRCYAR